MSAQGGEGGEPKFLVNSELSYETKSCSECQQDVRKIERQKYRQTDRQTIRLTERQIQDRKTIQLSYQNKSWSECQKDVIMTNDRQNDRKTKCQNRRVCPPAPISLWSL